MGQRAHNRRHEGRAIRKERRELLSALEQLPSLSAQWAEMGRQICEAFAVAARALSESFLQLAAVLKNDPLLQRVPNAGNDNALPPKREGVIELSELSQSPSSRGMGVIEA